MSWVLDLEFVRWIEWRHRHVDNAKLTDRAMDTSRADHHAGHGLEWNDFAVCLEIPFTFQHDINLGHFLVVMSATVRVNVGEMDRGQTVPIFLESTA